MQLEDIKIIQTATTFDPTTDKVVVAPVGSLTPKAVTVATLLGQAGIIAGAKTFSGNVTLGAAFIGSVQSLSGAGAVNVTTEVTAFTSTDAAQALTLANGTAGQRKVIIHEVDGGSGVLTPTTKTGFTTITFTNAGDSCVLRYLTTRGWMIESLNGAVAA